MQPNCNPLKKLRGWNYCDIGAGKMFIQGRPAPPLSGLTAGKQNDFSGNEKYCKKPPGRALKYDVACSKTANRGNRGS
jgi:hypothetical protein